MINTNTTVDELREMSKSENTAIRIAVAEFENTPDSILSEMINDKDEFVLQQIAENQNASEETLTKLFHTISDMDKIEEVKIIIEDRFLWVFKYKYNKKALKVSRAYVVETRILSHKNINYKVDGEFGVKDPEIKKLLCSQEKFHKHQAYLLFSLTIILSVLIWGVFNVCFPSPILNVEDLVKYEESFIYKYDQWISIWPFLTAGLIFGLTLAWNYRKKYKN